MAIDDRTRKLLWGRSGNRCAMCKRELVLERRSSATDAVVGDECHIVSGRTGGPRHDPNLAPTCADRYDNLILLCRVHHKVIDDQPDVYTAQRLSELKAAHEKWVRERLSSANGRMGSMPRRVRVKVPSHLSRLCNGKQLLDLVVGAHAFAFDHEQDLNSDKAKLVGDFPQALNDYGDLGADLEPAQRVNASVDLSEALAEVESAGFFVFGGRELDRLEYPQAGDMGLVVAIVQVIRRTDPAIIKVDLRDVPANPTGSAPGRTRKA